MPREGFPRKRLPGLSRRPGGTMRIQLGTTARSFFAKTRGLFLAKDLHREGDCRHDADQHESNAYGTPLTIIQFRADQQPNPGAQHAAGKCEQPQLRQFQFNRFHIVVTFAVPKSQYGFATMPRGARTSICPSRTRTSKQGCE